MILCKWGKLPIDLQCDEVRKYYDILSHHKMSLLLKRLFDIVASLILMIVLSPVFLITSVAIFFDSRGGVLYRQIRITRYNRKFTIYKFRTMFADADKIGSNLTVKGDRRVTRVGKLLRGVRFDELPQLYNILLGDMTFVGTRPEVMNFVNRYTLVMKATLLLPAGVTSDASIYYKDESMLLDAGMNIDKTYVETVLPGKMYYNLKAIEHFSFGQDIKTLIRTVLAICGREYIGDYKGQAMPSTSAESLTVSKRLYNEP